MNKKEKYSPALDMEARVDNLVILLQDANCYSPANGAAASLWNNPKAYREEVRKFYKLCGVCFSIGGRFCSPFVNLITLERNLTCVFLNECVKRQ